MSERTFNPGPTRAAWGVASTFLRAGFCVLVAQLSSGQAAAQRPHGLTARVTSVAYPGRSWETVSPARAGYSKAGLDSALGMAHGLKTSAFMVIVHGRTLLQYGNVAETSYVASSRKSLLSMLYGRYVQDGTIRLDETLRELGMDDVGGLLPKERDATVEDLLEARSGVFHPAGYPGDDLDNAPPRGSRPHGTYYLYSNWDFDAAGYVFEHQTGRNIYDAFLTDIAQPIGMQDYYRGGQKKEGDSTVSRYPAYPFVLSTRDMARVGYLMLRNGRWRGRVVVPETWVRMSTRAVTANSEIPSAKYRETHMGYGYLWWVYDHRDSTDARYHGFAALGARGQFIVVLPKLDMVVAHKVVVRGEEGPFPSVSLVDFNRLVDAVIAARCAGRCND